MYKKEYFKIPMQLRNIFNTFDVDFEELKD